MRKADILMHDEHAGILEEIKPRSLYRFTYAEEYKGPSVSLMTEEGRVALTPAYDILNTSLALSEPLEEIALPVKGKKRKLDSVRGQSLNYELNYNS